MRMRGLVSLVLAAALAACAAKAPPRPVGTASPDPSVVQVFADVTRQCRGLRTLTAEIALSGRAADERLRGRLHAGFAAPQSMRLEAVAPFGPPAFILAAQAGDATVLFPREKRVLPSTPVASVLERLTGLALGADDLRLVLSGCLVAEPNATAGQAWSNGWKAVTLATDRVAYLREVRGAWVIAAADYAAWRIDYADHVSGWPRSVRVRGADGSGIDLTARLTQLQVNVDLPDTAFTVDVPPNSERITIDDLRSVAPLSKPGH